VHRLGQFPTCSRHAETVLGAPIARFMAQCASNFGGLGFPGAGSSEPALAGRVVSWAPRCLGRSGARGATRPTNVWQFRQPRVPQPLCQTGRRGNIQVAVAGGALRFGTNRAPNSASQKVYEINGSALKIERCCGSQSRAPVQGFKARVFRGIFLPDRCRPDPELIFRRFRLDESLQISFYENEESAH
jgi:hypothetical protein